MTGLLAHHALLNVSLRSPAAENSAVQVDVYGAEIVWQNRVQTVEVLATGARPLLGMLLLDGCEMNVRFADNEIVTVNPL